MNLQGRYRAARAAKNRGQFRFSNIVPPDPEIEITQTCKNPTHKCHILKLDPEDILGMTDIGIFFNEKIQNFSSK